MQLNQHWPAKQHDACAHSKDILGQRRSFSYPTMQTGYVTYTLIRSAGKGKKPSYAVYQSLILNNSF